jgi:hypothetical protein
LKVFWGPWLNTGVAQKKKDEMRKRRVTLFSTPAS